MNHSILRSSLTTAAALLLGANPANTAEFSPSITGIHVRDSQTVMAWTNGRPAYQVQARSSLNHPWANVGSPTSALSMTLPSNGTQAFFRVVSDFTARYKVVFNSTWSQTTHPTNWPSGAHWSGLVGGTHGDAVHFWREGEPASEGIRLMAERGQQATLLSEIAPAIASGKAQLQLAGGGIGGSPGSVSLTFPQVMTRDFPLVTLVTMIAPSPDWFAGVDSLSLIENGKWVSNKVATLYGYDAGTDSGSSYASPDFVTVPREVVTRFAGFPAIQNGIVVPFGTFTFTRLD
jgi:hypothetical protein